MLRCVECSKLFLLALVSLGLPSVIAQSFNGSVEALDVNLVDTGAAGVSGSVGVAGSVTNSAALNVHNDVRSAVFASNMEYVNQNGGLTGDIEDWLSQCSYSDSIPVHWNDATYRHVNGFKAWSPYLVTISSAIGALSRLSASKELYKLLMKSDIGYLGCGEVQCGWFNMVACLYASRTELDLDEAPYKTGVPCTECTSGSYWCYDNLCRADCSNSNYQCECQINCGLDSPIASNCSCPCPSGHGVEQCKPNTNEPRTTTVSNEDSPTSNWRRSGTTLVVSVTLVMLALLCISLCLVLYHKKYRPSKLRPAGSSLESGSPPARETNVYSTPVSLSTTFDPSKYPTLPPAYSTANLTTDLNPPPYAPFGYTASPSDAAEELGDGGTPSPPPLYEQINVEYEAVS